MSDPMTDQLWGLYAEHHDAAPRFENGKAVELWVRDAAILDLHDRVKALESRTHMHIPDPKPSKDEVIARITVEYADLRGRVAQYVEWLRSPEAQVTEPPIYPCVRTDRAVDRLRELGLIEEVTP